MKNDGVLPRMNDNHILVVEDEFLVGLNIKLTLTDAGFSVTGPATSVSEALVYIKNTGHFDAAVLDVNLGDETSCEIVKTLSDIGIPYLLITGYGRENLPPNLADSPMIEKPINDSTLVDLVMEICRKAKLNTE